MGNQKNVKTNNKIVTLLDRIRGPLPRTIKEMAHRWKDGDTDPEFLPLLDKYAQLDQLRSSLRRGVNVPARLRGYPISVREAQQMVSQLRTFARGKTKTANELSRDYERVKRRLDRQEEIEQQRVDRRLDKNPLHGTSIIRGASRARRDRPRYHPDN
jgi:hypothetical protein